MTPHPETRLDGVIRTLNDVVVPALGPEHAMAREQSAVILAQLRMLKTQLVHIGDYHALCRDDVRDTATELVHEIAGGPKTEEAASGLAAALKKAEGERDPYEAYNLIGFALEWLIHAVPLDADLQYRARVERGVFAFSRRQVRRERIWFKDAGFDPYPNELPSIAEMMRDGA